MRIVLLIRALERGGAERQLATLAEGLSNKGHEVHVLSFYAGGELWPDLQRAGVPVQAVNKGGRWDMIGFFTRLVRALRELRPEVLYTSMPAANIAGAVAARLAGRPPVVWRVASSEMDLARYNWFSGLSYRLEALCAGVPAAIVANSHAGGEAAVTRGFTPERVSVVWNGIRTDLFRPDPGAGAAFRRDLRLDAAGWLIGQVARSDPKKGWEDFIDAARILCDRRSDVRFLGVGIEAGDYGRGLKERAERLGIGDRVVWHGLEQDIVSVYNALDINTLASRFGEGCPNAVGEAMACGVPCVVTDVGDAPLVTGSREQVVPPAKPEALADAWARLLERLETEREEISGRSRERIVERFSVERYVNETEAVLLGVR